MAKDPDVLNSLVGGTFFALFTVTNDKGGKTPWLCVSEIIGASVYEHDTWLQLKDFLCTEDARLMDIALATTWHTGRRHEGPSFSEREEWECPMKGQVDKVPLYVSRSKCITKEVLNQSAIKEVRKALAVLDNAGSSPIASTFLGNNGLSIEELNDLHRKKKKRRRK